MTDKDAQNASEELRQLRAALRATQGQLAQERLAREEVEARLRRSERLLDNAWEQLATLRNSDSWRATAPLRLAKRRFGAHLR
ncbi:hypothetical protein SAMN05421878_1128 [Actinobaculum suis]|uniref:Uncharacterized protein n=1 Tax=Actinobaculum suis TaxID=1657 RepID=A0A1G7DMB2_9ACTO|nr:hypothetical protein [Actinobaculum suis]SDE52622.1 hypothetical protein SAMN05421878_1128 [Actinobaculum suis]VDG75930.1 Uncharacterised protein [Actinobaculum suis]